MTWCGAPSPLPRMLACPPSCASVWPLFVSVRSVHVRKTLDSCIPTQCTRQIFIKIKKKDCIAVRQDEWTYVARLMVQYSVKRFFFFITTILTYGVWNKEKNCQWIIINRIGFGWLDFLAAWPMGLESRRGVVKRNITNRIWFGWLDFLMPWIMW